MDDGIEPDGTISEQATDTPIIDIASAMNRNEITYLHSIKL
jgi:hypothetical protein